MTFTKGFAITVAALVLLGLASSTAFTVDRADYVYRTRFGRHVASYDGRSDAGLHWKWPWPIEAVIRLDSRLQFFDLREQQLPTREANSTTPDKMLMIGAYVCWRIAGSDESGDGVDRFVRTVSTGERARSILEQRILSRLGAEVGKMSMEQFLSVMVDSRIDKHLDRLFLAGGGTLTAAFTACRIDLQLEQLRGRLLGSDARGMVVPGPESSLKQLVRQDYGIELVDIRLRRYNYPASVRPEIVARIISEREKKAAEHTSDGMKLAVDIESAARRQARDIDTQARAQEKRLKEEAAVKADAIRNEAHAKDPEFYTFLQKLDAYQTMLSGSRDVLLLSSQHELFDLLLKPPRIGGHSSPRNVAPNLKQPASLVPAGYELLPPPKVAELVPAGQGGP
jgi:membrane protease subunit HflC